MGLIIFLLIFLLFVLALLFVITSSLIGFLQTRVPFVPTGRGDIEFIVKKFNLNQSDIFFDLGSGDGKVCFLVEELTGAKTMGFELTWWTHLLAKIKKIFKKSKAEFVCADFFQAPWNDATIVYSYLYPPLMGRVEEKFLKDCKAGSMAIIRDFPFPNLKPNEVYFMPKSHEIYIYYKS